MVPGTGIVTPVTAAAPRSDTHAPAIGAMILGTGSMFRACADHLASDATPRGTYAESLVNGAGSSGGYGRIKSMSPGIAASMPTAAVLGSGTDGEHCAGPSASFPHLDGAPVAPAKTSCL